MTISDLEHDMDEVEELEAMLRRGKAAIFSDHRDGREETADNRAQVRKALAAARQATTQTSRHRRLRFPLTAVGSLVAAAVVTFILYLGVLPVNTAPSGVTVVSFLTAESDIAPPLMRGGESESVEGWLQAARDSAIAIRGADQVHDAESGSSGMPSAEFLSNVKTPMLLTLEEAERNGEKCLAVRLYLTQTGKMTAERLVFPPEEDDVGTAIEKAVQDVVRQAASQ
jgi:hypothetical protein